MWGMGNDQTIPKRGDATHDKQSLQQLQAWKSVEREDKMIEMESGSLWNVAPINASCKMDRMYLPCL